MKEERLIEIRFWLFIENYISERTSPAHTMHLAAALSALTEYPVTYITGLIQDVLNASVRLKPSKLELIQFYADLKYPAKKVYSMLNLTPSAYYKRRRENDVYWIPRYNELQRQVMKDVLKMLDVLDRSVVK